MYTKENYRELEILWHQLCGSCHRIYKLEEECHNALRLTSPKKLDKEKLMFDKLAYQLDEIADKLTELNEAIKINGLKIED